MPIIKDFQSTTRWKAFILNSIAASISIVVALIAKSYFEVYKDVNGNIISVNTSKKSMLITFVITFIATLTSYFILYFLTGYGGGQLSNS